MLEVAREQKKIALVVGNSAYEYAATLPNPENDARAISSALETLGFDVSTCIDADCESMKRDLEEFKVKASGAGILLFYYSGHGLQVDGRNYLVPVDAELVLRSDLGRLSPVQELIDELGSAADTRLFFLDACRSDPFDRSETRVAARCRDLSGTVRTDLSVANVQKGLATLHAGSETFIGFSAAPGEVALDGEGAYSPYTEAMLMHLPTRGLELQQLMARVGATVRQKTLGFTGQPVQDPWTSTNLGRQVFLAPQLWQPVYVLALLGAIAGLLTAFAVFGNSDCYREVPGIGLLFGAVVGFGVWAWGRGTWEAALIAVMTTALSWAAGGILIEKNILLPSDTIMKFCKEGIAKANPAHVAFIVFAGLIALIGTLAGAAWSSRAIRSVTAFSTTLLVGSVVLATIYIISLSLHTFYISHFWSVFKVYAATMIWFGGLGASIGYAFASYVPSGPTPE